MNTGALSPHVAALVWWIVAVLPLTLGVLAAVEGWLYWTGRDPITAYVRNWAWGHWLPAVFIGAALLVAMSMAFTHFLVDR